MNSKYLATILNPVTPDRIEMIREGALLVSEKGKILFAGPVSDAPEGPCETIDYSDLVISPGFVDTHVHVSQARAANVRCGELLPWLNKVIFPMEAGYTREVAALEAPRFFQHLLSMGTTCAAVYVTISKDATDAAFLAAEHTGIRAIIGKVMMDRFCPDYLCEKTETSIEKSIALCDKWHGAAEGRLRYAFTPRFALTCSEKLMKKAGQEAQKRNCHIMTHVAENRDEVKRAKELFPKSRSYLDVYNQADMLFPGAIFAHGIYLDDEDLELMHKTGAGIAHCPVANFTLESGILDLSAVFALGVSVGLGSDIGAGSDPMMARVAEAMVFSQSARKVLGQSFGPISAERAFYLMTLGGAASLGLSEKIGSLEAGKEADFLVLDPRPCMPLGEWSGEDNICDLIWALILRFRAKTICQIYVHGKKIELSSKSTDSHN